MGSEERVHAMRHRLSAWTGGALLVAAVVIGVAGVVVYVRGSDLGAVVLVVALALFTAGAGVLVATTRSSGARTR